jgi:hypothetical protein
MLKPEQLFIIIYVNVFVKCVYPHKAKNNILWSATAWSFQPEPYSPLAHGHFDGAMASTFL